MLQGGGQFVPRNLLSKEVAGKSPEEITQALSQERGHALYLKDVEPRADIDQLFVRWRGEFQVDESPSLPDRVVVTFNTADQLKEAMTAFGGGLRGTFRVDRQLTLGKGNSSAVWAFVPAAVSPPHCLGHTSSSNRLILVYASQG